LRFFSTDPLAVKRLVLSIKQFPTIADGQHICLEAPGEFPHRVVTD
jgi:hypothetical protein